MEIETVSPSLLEVLIRNLSTLAAVYHKLPESIVDAGHFTTDPSLSTVQ
jgi:hypothetical protein